MPCSVNQKRTQQRAEGIPGIHQVHGTGPVGGVAADQNGTFIGCAAFCKPCEQKSDPEKNRIAGEG